MLMFFWLLPLAYTAQRARRLYHEKVVALHFRKRDLLLYSCCVRR
jgi:hypothetical protein